MKVITKTVFLVLGIGCFFSCNKAEKEQIELLKAQNQATIEMAEKHKQLAMEQQIKAVEQMRDIKEQLDSSFVVIDSLQRELQKCRK